MAIEKRSITSMEDLTKDLVRNYELLKAGKMEIQQARALMDTADKVIQGLRTQMAYNAMQQRAERIPFLEGSTELPTSPRKRLNKRLRVK